MESENTDRELVTVAEAAKHLSRSTEQVRRYLREGRLTARRIGGQWFIERSALDAFSTGATRESRFRRSLRPANRQHPLDAVIGIGEGPSANISAGKHAYRLASLRSFDARNRG